MKSTLVTRAEGHERRLKKAPELTADLLGRRQESMVALELHIASDVSKANVEYYKAGGLAAPLEEMDIRVHTEYRQAL